jgi:L-lactate dehydrogenase complex protein LldG
LKVNESRNNILKRLRANREHSSESPEVYLPQYDWSKQEKIERLIERMTSVRTEVHELADGNWIDWLNTELPKRKLMRVLVGNGETGDQFIQQARKSLQVQRYQQPIENWKQQMFHDIDVGLTTTIGGIAESGSLMLWPNADEPRLMSLAPPVHIALLDADKIYENFAQAMHQLNWATQMPTNALLISGPSKTADIEQTLAYGIHGPRQLIVLMLG